MPERTEQGHDERLLTTGPVEVREELVIDWAASICWTPLWKSAPEKLS
jgi:hypothetical protein